jgi:hypothetical protein
VVPQYLLEGQLGCFWCFAGWKGWSLHLADELTAECVNNTGDGRLLALADEVEVKHALDGLGLHSAVAIVSGILAVVCLLRRGKHTRRNILSWGGRACGRAEE